MVIWVSKLRTRWMLVVPTIFLVPSPTGKGIFSNKVFVLLIPRCSASSLMLSIGTSGVGLNHNTEPIGVTFRSILENGTIASEVALIEDTRRKELFYFQTSPSTSVDFFFKKFSRITYLYRKTERKK